MCLCTANPGLQTFASGLPGSGLGTGDPSGGGLLFLSIVPRVCYCGRPFLPIALGQGVNFARKTLKLRKFTVQEHINTPGKFHLFYFKILMHYFRVRSFGPIPV